MFLHITTAEYLGNYRLRLRFNTGAVKDVDLSAELHGDIFVPLRDLATFRQGAVNPETGTIEWPNGADFAPEFLFGLGEDVKSVA